MARKGGNPLIYAKPLKDVPMAETPMSVRLPVELHEYVKSRPNRTEWLRTAIAAQIERDLSRSNEGEDRETSQKL